jgi:hypothetical protein
MKIFMALIEVVCPFSTRRRESKNFTGGILCITKG